MSRQIAYQTFFLLCRFSLFVNCITGVHTQNIESYWNSVKIKIKHMKGCHQEQLASYLDECIYRERYGHRAREVFDKIFQILHNSILYRTFSSSYLQSLLYSACTIFCYACYTYHTSILHRTFSSSLVYT